MQLKGLFKGDRDDGGGGGRRESSASGSSSARGDGRFMSKAKALLQNAAAPLSARGRERTASERPYFNPEEHISEKREWARRYTQSHSAQGLEAALAPRPDRLFEHFAVVGLPPNMNIRAVAADIKTFQRVAREAGAAGGGGGGKPFGGPGKGPFAGGGGGGAAMAAGGLEVTADTAREEKQRQYGLKGPVHQAEVLYSFPSHPMPADLEESLPTFCFPHGVRPELLERTPSMSALNEVIYSQPYQTHDDHSFVFLMKVADPGSVVPRTLYGVCCYVRELVHRPPSLAREAYPGCTAPLSRYLVVAPRCYCLLTHHPFFALHFRVLQTILGLERLERMTSFASELAGLEGGGEAGAPPAAAWPPSQASSCSAAGGAASSAAGSQAASVGGPAAAASAGVSPASGGGGAAGMAAAAAARAQEEEEEASSSEASSRRWTEGSSVAAAEEPLPRGPLEAGLGGADAAAAALLGLTLTEEQQQLAQRPRPSRLAQVSPHCPQAPASAAAVAGTPQDGSHPRPDAAAAAEGQAEALTPADQVVGAAAAVGSTPYFTPAGLSSAIGTPGSRRSAAAWEQQQRPALAAVAEEPEAGGLGVRRTLERSLSEAEGGSPAAVAEAAAAAGDSADTDAAEALAAAVVAGSRPGSGQGLQQGEQEFGDGSSSDGESYISASSSAALLAQSSSVDGSPATAAALLSARKAQHARSASGGLAPALSPARAAAAAAAAAGEGGQEAGLPPPPLLDLQEEAPAEEQQDQQQQQERQQQQPPLLDLGAAEEQPGEQHQQQERQQGQPEVPLLDLAAPEVTPVKEEQLVEQQLGSGVAVRIVKRCYSSPAHGPGLGRTDTPPRADLLAGAALSRSARHAPPQPADAGLLGQLSSGELLAAAAAEAAQQPGQQGLAQQGAAPAAAAAQPAAAGAQQQGAPEEEEQQQQQQQQAWPDLPPPPPSQQGQPQQQGQQQQQQQQQLVQHEVVRVTASNLDMSRPLRSADLLAVYHASLVPRPGQVFEFQPDPGLQTIEFERPDFLEAVRELGLRPDAASLPDIDAASNLGGWAVAALCRAMSLDNLLTFLTAALLERQIVVFCPNAGLLSGVVLSLVPLLLPFHWQSLMLPVLPAAEGRLEIMEAPVPFVLGVLYKTPEVRAKSGGLVRVNVYKDKVKNAGGLPPLPQQAALHDALAGTYAELRKIGLTRTAITRPVHMISDAQQVLAECFLSTLQKYLRGLVADMRAYCITDVSASMERTSVLLKDSFVDSFPPRDRPFMRQFAETQMFSVYSDAVIS